jgi:hypothetical protein
MKRSSLLSFRNPDSCHGSQSTLNGHRSISVDEELKDSVRIFAALGGPVISLLQCILFISILTDDRKKRVGHLFFLRLGLLGLVNFNDPG